MTFRNTKKPIVICAFAGCGKSTFAQNKKALDLDSSFFDKADFPDNYAFSIKDFYYNSSFDYILVSTHSEIREELYNLGIPFILVHPNIELKEEYLQRYIQRGSDKSFIKTFKTLWEDFVRSCMNDCYAEEIIELNSGEYLSSLKYK